MGNGFSNYLDPIARVWSIPSLQVVGTSHRRKEGSREQLWRAKRPLAASEKVKKDG